MSNKVIHKQSGMEITTEAGVTIKRTVDDLQRDRQALLDRIRVYEERLDTVNDNLLKCSQASD